MAEENEEEAPPEAGGGNKKMLIIIIAAVLVVLLGGGGAAFMMMSGGKEEPAAEGEEGSGEVAAEGEDAEAKEGEEVAEEEAPKEAEEEVAEEEAAKEAEGEEGEAEVVATHNFGKTLALKPFHLNLGNPLENRYIRLEIALEFRGGDSQLKEIEARLPQLRDAVNSVASRKTRDFLLGPDGKDQLRLELTNRINQYMEKKIEAVYITDILIE